MTEQEKPVIRLSVHGVVDASLHDPDLAPAAGQARRMREGSAAHRARQAAGEAAEAGWRSEVPLEACYEAEKLTLRVTGRADAILQTAEGLPLIEEIKLGEAETPLRPAHMAQAELYGHMLCREAGCAALRLRVLYVSAEGEPLKAYEQDETAEALARRFEALCAPAAETEAEKLFRREKRDAALGACPFPYPDWRPGQKKFSAGVWQAIEGRKRLFAQAPTGIGKTIAALYPALRALPEKKASRVLFLTARNTGRKSAMDAAGLLSAPGLLVCEITAKDKACVLEKRDCRPEACPRAAGFYDRLPEALREARRGGIFGAPEIAVLAEKYALCPFELSLELAKEADLAVCDYNYVYDPMVAVDGLLRGSALLVDEAHQLAPRVRSGYSAALSFAELTRIRHELRESGTKDRKNPLYAALSSLLKLLTDAAGSEGFGTPDWQLPEDFHAAAEILTETAAKALAEGGGKPAADAFSLGAAWSFAKSHFSERWAVLSSGGPRSAEIRLALLDAAPEILAVSKQARGTAYFSATLSPQSAMGRILGTEEGDLSLLLPSPFDPGQLRVTVAPLDVRYAARERTAPEAARLIREHLAAGRENSLAFFPSYAYLSLIAPMLEQEPVPCDFLRERRGMTEAEKAELLAQLVPGRERPAALLAVLGGAFSEAVDLPGERLGSVVIISTGMPQPDAENEALRRLYDREGADGFLLTMTLPGMVRVIQAAGRLIRTPEDRGRLLLIDSRYGQRQIRRLLEGTLIAEAMSDF